MFQLKDDFRACDDNKQSYSFKVERHTETANLHAWVREDRFYLSSVGNRFILNTPAFSTGTFSMMFQFTYMDVFPTNFTVLFQYDEAGRKGMGIKFAYDLISSFEISLVEVNKSRVSVINTLKAVVEKPLTEGELYSFSMKIKDEEVCGSIAQADYRFPCDCRKGKLALERGNYIGELAIDWIRFSSEDIFELESVVKETTAVVPCINGGNIPYSITWSIDRIEGEYYLTSKLDGGTRTRPVNREDRPGQYGAEKDWMTSPYICLVSSGLRGVAYNIARGEKCFIDPNIYWDCQKGFFGDTELPIVNTYKIPGHLIFEDLEIIFGYENLVCTGYGTQVGGCEFRYTRDGKLLHYGQVEDGRDIYEVKSQENKLALTFVPQDCYNRHEVVEHIKNNHYFDVSEDIEFWLEMKTLSDPDYISIEAAVLNVYETEVLGRFLPNIKVEQREFGYHLLTALILVPKMSIGVYKIEFCIFYGGKLYERVVKTFEVYDKDSDQNPALASGLPFTFSMPNEHKWLMRGSFDLWNPAKSCNVEHYITCITDTPIEAEIREPWRMIKYFKREWFAWLSSRTCRNWQIEEHPEVVKNADYLFCSWNEKVMDLSQSGLYPIRQDHFAYHNFMMRESTRVAILDSFLEENPQIAEKVDYKVGMEKFTFDHFINLMKTCPSEWIAYQNCKGLALLKEQNGEIRKINPQFRRSIYGPISAYVTPTLTSHSLKAYCTSNPKALAEDIFTGFAIYEDYPYSCAYQTYRGAFGVMTILLECPELVIYPEQYKGSSGGCIDGAVKFAHAPMGKYTLLPYQNSTHAFEYVFNTAYRLEDGFHYWNTYGFHRPDFREEMMAKLVLDWKYVIENKPKKPLKSIAFLAEYTDKEDIFDVFHVDEENCGCYLNNRTESGQGLVYECSREAGVPNGFALKYDCLKNLTAEDCDVLVLPNLAYASEEAVAQIRRLYEEGVNLIAVSEVDGLEDIFGVVKEEKGVEVNCISYEGEMEYVRGNESFLSYRPCGAQVIMTSDKDDPLTMRTNRTLLINTAVINLGCEDSPTTNHAKTLHIVGGLVRKMLTDMVRKLSSPLVLGENVGVTLFETQSDKRMLLAIDYTPFDNREQGIRQAIVKLNMLDVMDVKADREIFVCRKNGVVKELRFDVLPHESVFVELCN